MLQELTIRNFAIIASLKLPFHSGMTALTGETGAGKSIIIDAVSLLAGSRGSSDFIRQGAKSCLLEGLFDIPQQPEFAQLAAELGIELTEGWLVLQRDIYQSGKSICRVNGRILTLANLRRIGAYLVDIQGQNEHQELLDQERHLGLLDSFADDQFKQQKAAYRQKFLETEQLAAKFQKIKNNEQAYIQRMDMLAFQKEEIAEADLQSGEEERLLEEREKLSNHQRIADALAFSYQALTADGQSAVDQIGTAMSEMQEIAGLDEAYKAISEDIQSAYYLLQDTVIAIGRQVEGLEYDENRLSEVQQRLELLRQLKRKYGDTVAEMLDYYDMIVRELEQSAIADGELETLEHQLQIRWEELRGEAQQLHEQRLQIAKRLEQAVLQELAGLYMENTDFKIDFKVLGKLHEAGSDQVAFYLTSNPGEPLKPLVKVASGGELSRVMLALKTVFSKKQGITSIVFDEVDTGVSGRVAQAIANKIYQIAENSQVLCITHLPQVAAMADYEYYISKEVADQRTETQVRELTAEERVQEIARMLAGSEITELAVEHAKELLAMAKK